MQTAQSFVLLASVLAVLGSGIATAGVITTAPMSTDPAPLAPGTVTPIAIPPAAAPKPAPAPASAVAPASMQSPSYGPAGSNGAAPGAANNGQPAAVQLPPLPESQAFQGTLQSTMPLTPAQIAQLRQQINQNRRAEEAPLSPAQPIQSTINARLGVGSPPAISVQSGYVSTLNVVDAYGRPWPIVRKSVGNPKAFTVSVAGNSAAISDLQPYAQSDLALYLEGEATPLMVALVPGSMNAEGGGEVDYSVRLRVDTLEPGLPVPAGGVSGGGNYTNTLLSLAQDVAPDGAKPLDVVGDPARIEAWLWRGPRGVRVLIRAPGTVIAPAWIATMQGTADMQAWVLPDVRVFTLSRNGRPQTITLRRYGYQKNARPEGRYGTE